MAAGGLFHKHWEIIGLTHAKDPAFVRFQGIEKRFGDLVAVQPMDLDIAEGSFVTLLGPSGCGKTTLLRMLAAFGLKYRDVSKTVMKEKVEKALETVRLPGVGNRMPSQLSGGQQQRIALARAIVIEPDVLLMDEPLSALDENLREDMRREIDNLQMELGVTTIFVTHDQREALSMSDKVVVMKDGYIQQEGEPEEVYNNSVNHFVADFLGHSNFLNARVQTRKNGYYEAKLLDDSICLASPVGEFDVGENAEIVIRAQKMTLGYQKDYAKEDDMNFFFGKIKDRSYMGGEVSYFVELADGQLLHVINFVKRSPYRRGDEVYIRVDPFHCRLLKL